jgi:UDP-glucuronate decarboxylase
VETTVGELARLVTEGVGSRSRVVYKPLPVDDPRRRRPDITQARTVLGWSPKVELATGLQRTIAYFDELLRRGQLSRTTARPASVQAPRPHHVPLEAVP